MYKSIGLVGLVVVTGCSRHGTETEGSHNSQRISDEQAAAYDAADAAKDLGIPEDDVDALLRKSAALKDSTRWMRKRVDVWVGATVGRGREQAPTVYIKGEAEDAIREAIAASEIEIILVDAQPYSQEELMDRKDRLVAELFNLGYRDTSAYFDIKRSGRIFATARREAEAPQSADDALAQLSPEFRDIGFLLSDEPVYHAQILCA